MDTQPRQTSTVEFAGASCRGGVMLLINLGLLGGGTAWLIHAFAHGHGWPILAAVVLQIAAIILLCGHFTLEPNEARVLVLFGRYHGTIRRTGFHWANPFYSRGNPPAGLRIQAAAQEQGKSSTVHSTAMTPMKARYKISLRARTLNMETLKVNDKRGNPVEIAAIIIWQVVETARAVFDVDELESYVYNQSEIALRHVASTYTYDDSHNDEPTLRSNIEEVSKKLLDEIQQRLDLAGVIVVDARLSHLAYAQEIAQVMLRRQQAEAVVAARQIIVHNAVSMVDMALRELAEKHVVTLDDDRKAAMVSNLLVVLCSEHETSPVINTGTLYT